MDRVILPLAARLPVDLSLSFTGAPLLPAVDGAASGLLSTAVTVDGLTAALLVERPAAGAPLRCIAASDHLPQASQQQRLTEEATHWLNLEDDLRPFYALADLDRRFSPIRDLLYGYRPPRFTSAFAAACWAVLARRTPPALARRRHTALAARFGAGVAVDSVTITAFPTAGRLAVLSPSALLPYAGDSGRAGTVVALAQAFATVNEAWLRGGPYDAVASWLRALPGGPWEVEAVLLDGLGRMERAPLTEPALVAAVARCYGVTEPAAIARIAARYGPWQGYWARYLTRSVAELAGAR